MSTKDEVGITAAQAAIHSTVDPELLAVGFELLRTEKQVSFRVAIRQHWRALLWSCVLSLALVMDGYDGSIINSFYGLPAFKAKFGTEVNGKKIITANWQAALSNIGLPGGFLGLAITGYCQEKFGSRKTYIGGMIATIGVVFLFVFCKNLKMLLAAEALASCCWAMFNTLTAAYAVEICPIHLRGYATSYISMAWGTGSFISAGVQRAALVIPGDWAWRMPYCIQWFWPAVLVTAAIFAPESPWWLVRKGRTEEARKTLLRIASPGYWDDKNIDAYIAVIQHTDDLERAEAATGSFWELFKGTNLRRTEISLGAWAIQVWSGTAMTAYAVTFLEAAGLSVTAAFDLNLGVTGGNLVGCCIEFMLISKFGRRPLILIGLCILAVCLLLIGVVGTVSTSTSSLALVGACMVGINLFYHASVGPLTYTVAAEVPSSRLRARTVALGRAFYQANYAVTNQLSPRMISSAAWNWKMKTAFFWLGGNLTVLTWTYFRLPETRGRSFAEMSILFGNKVPARKWSSTVVVDEVVGRDVTFEDKVDGAGSDQGSSEEEKKVYESEHVERAPAAAKFE